MCLYFIFPESVGFDEIRLHLLDRRIISRFIGDKTADALHNRRILLMPSQICASTLQIPEGSWSILPRA